MGLFKPRKSRATKRAEAKAIKSKAKLEARLSARNERRRDKAEGRRQTKVAKVGVKAQRNHDKTALKIAEAQLKAAQEGKLLSPSSVRRVLTVSRMLAPVAVPLIYRAAVTARGVIDQRKADELGVPLSQIGQFSGSGGALSARIAGAERSLQQVAQSKPKDAETKQFVTAVSDRLSDLAAAITAAENMPGPQRRSAHARIGQQLDGIDADLLARLNVA